MVEILYSSSAHEVQWDIIIMFMNIRYEIKCYLLKLIRLSIESANLNCLKASLGVIGT